ncbi:hypothetical protein N7535_004937 [Penicillium sp. DV-2018c]|nr:hypothetical protein N7461_008518 [Penicillium sp. DV-2018c]KAJ5571277.1 hypothetical protein N7535_004937 [Penicillium sp. DV-2018c]
MPLNPDTTVNPPLADFLRDISYATTWHGRIKLPSRAILTPRNDFVHAINDLLLDRTPGTCHTLYYADSWDMVDDDFANADDITPEFLKSTIQEVID